MGEAVKKYQVRELYTPEEAAELMRMKRQNVYVMVSRGDIPVDLQIRIGRRLRFDAVRFRSWLADNDGTSRTSAK